MFGKHVDCMVVMTLITVVLFVLLLFTLAMSYLIYVRLKDLQREVERLRSKMEVEEEELENIESSLKSLDM
jgi:cell division protein FtsL